ncbi:hypothetical protein NC653_031719 [Populus alba x Populus x berolinensis]|uniref:Uncharacterized protein n=1 Tax=Populus alba x Populus x berolinensis TaxID=444605 RepID=A0AAD6LZ91_9ROSI|nr:hypothetical protein NC653_031719 [Populus alba x Populus x berolinensis]
MRGIGYLMFLRMRQLMFFTWIIRIVIRLMIFPLEKLLLSSLLNLSNQLT